MYENIGSEPTTQAVGLFPGYILEQCQPELQIQYGHPPLGFYNHTDSLPASSVNTRELFTHAGEVTALRVFFHPLEPRYLQ